MRPGRPQTRAPGAASLSDVFGNALARERAGCGLVDGRLDANDASIVDIVDVETGHSIRGLVVQRRAGRADLMDLAARASS